MSGEVQVKEIDLLGYSLSREAVIRPLATTEIAD